MLSPAVPISTQTPLVGAPGLEPRSSGCTRHQYSNVDPDTESASPGTDP